jgi:transposase
MAQENTIPFDLPGFAIDQVDEHENLLIIQAHSTAISAVCPYCDHSSRRVHSYYTRSPRDLSCSGRKLRLVLRVHRFYCPNEGCTHKTFAERIPRVVPFYGQRTARLTSVFHAIAFELSAEAGARVSHHLNMPFCGDTLLKILRETPISSTSAVRVLGVDDWAFRKGRTYGTLLVDLERHRPIDLLPNRTAETLANWLQMHPGIEMVSRDRSGEYRAGITQGAPQAVQIADRWHLLKNLGDTVQRVLAKHPKILRDAARQAHEHLLVTTTVNKQQEISSLPDAYNPPDITYRQMLFDEVKALASQGESTRTIARRLHLHRQTVARYRELDELPPRITPQNISSVVAYLPYIQRRWAEGCRNGKHLWREICLQGYTGSYMSVYRAIRKFPDWSRQQQVPAGFQPAPSSLSPRQGMWLLVSDPDSLNEEQIVQREALCALCLEAAVVYPLAQRFVEMITESRSDALDQWLTDVLACDIAALRHFARSLRQDYAAVQAALTFKWSNGQVEGQVNRLKVIKRVMYGRAKFDLLRLRVLHPP